MKKQKIRVVIAEKPYAITVASQEEEQIVRAAARRLRDKMDDLLKENFKADISDFLAMAALQIAVEREELNHKLNYSVDKLQIAELNNQIEHFINQK